MSISTVESESQDFERKRGESVQWEVIPGAQVGVLDHVQVIDTVTVLVVEA